MRLYFFRTEPCAHVKQQMHFSLHPQDGLAHRLEALCCLRPISKECVLPFYGRRRESRRQGLLLNVILPCQIPITKRRLGVREVNAFSKQILVTPVPATLEFQP